MAAPIIEHTAALRAAAEYVTPLPGVLMGPKVAIVISRSLRPYGWVGGDGVVAP